MCCISSKDITRGAEALRCFPSTDVQKWLIKTTTINFEKEILDKQFWGKLILSIEKNQWKLHLLAISARQVFDTRIKTPDNILLKSIFQVNFCHLKTSWENPIRSFGRNQVSRFSMELTNCVVLLSNISWQLVVERNEFDCRERHYWLHFSAYSTCFFNAKKSNLEILCKWNFVNWDIDGKNPPGGFCEKWFRLSSDINTSCICRHSRTVDIMQRTVPAKRCSSWILVSYRGLRKRDTNVRVILPHKINCAKIVGFHKFDLWIFENRKVSYARSFPRFYVTTLKLNEFNQFFGKKMDRSRNLKQLIPKL